MERWTLALSLRSSASKPPVITWCRARASEVLEDEELFLNDDELPDAEEDFDIEFGVLARDAVVMYDRATDFGDMFPKGSRAHEDTLLAFRQWTKPDDVIQSFYCLLYTSDAADE